MISHRTKVVFLGLGAMTAVAVCLHYFLNFPVFSSPERIPASNHEREEIPVLID